MDFVSSDNEWDKEYKPLPSVFGVFLVIWTSMLLVWIWNTWTKRQWQVRFWTNSGRRKDFSVWTPLGGSHVPSKQCLTRRHEKDEESIQQYCAYSRTSATHHIFSCSGDPNVTAGTAQMVTSLLAEETKERQEQYKLRINLNKQFKKRLPFAVPASE